MKLPVSAPRQGGQLLVDTARLQNGINAQFAPMYPARFRVYEGTQYPQMEPIPAGAGEVKPDRSPEAWRRYIEKQRDGFLFYQQP